MDPQDLRDQLAQLHEELRPCAMWIRDRTNCSAKS